MICPVVPVGRSERGRALAASSWRYSGHVDAHPAWRVPAVEAGIDLAECHLRRDVMFRGVFWSLAIFAAVCGVTRLLSILTLWVPAYGIEGLANGFLALISVALSAAMLLMLPRILVLPTRIQLHQASAGLLPPSAAAAAQR